MSKQDVIDFIRAQIKDKPRERGRAALQGATFGFGDEALAGVRSLVSDKSYDELLEEERAKLEEYREARPFEAGAYEVGGAVLPGLAAAPFTAGASLPATVGRAALAGAASGGAYGFGSGEGGLEDRLISGGVSTASGAVLGPLGYAASRPISKGLENLTSFAARKMGGRPARAVESEIQRVASESGLTADEVIDRIGRGEIIAEMSDSAMDITRAYKAQGGRASQVISDALQDRPDKKARTAFAGLQKSMTGTTDENILSVVNQSEEALKSMESAAYKRIFKANPFIPKRDQNTIRTILANEPDILSDISGAFRRQSGRKPFFEVNDAGKVKFTRSPSLEEAEIVRRIVRDKATEAFRSGRGTVGESFSSVESRLKSRLDESFPELAQTRSNWSSIKSKRDAFEAGRKSLSKSPDEVEIEFSSITNKGPEQVNMYRAGVMAAIRAKRATGASKSMAGRIADTDKKERQILDMVVPEDAREEVLTALEKAAMSQKAKNKILGQSQTAITQGQSRRIGALSATQDIADALAGSPMAGIRLVDRLLSSSGRKLNDRQREQVARILVSENPDLVSRALTDEGALRQLNSIIGAATRRVSGASPFTVSPFAEPVGLLGAGAILE